MGSGSPVLDGICSPCLRMDRSSSTRQINSSTREKCLSGNSDRFRAQTSTPIPQFFHQTATQPLTIKQIVMNGGPTQPRGYDIFPDGKRFIVMLNPSDADSPQRQQINVVLNWFYELKQRVAAK